MRGLIRRPRVAREVEKVATHSAAAAVRAPPPEPAAYQPRDARATASPCEYDGGRAAI